jgi:hypothetical protein
MIPGSTMDSHQFRATAISAVALFFYLSIQQMEVESAGRNKVALSK